VRGVGQGRGAVMVGLDWPAIAPAAEGAVVGVVVAACAAVTAAGQQTAQRRHHGAEQTGRHRRAWWPAREQTRSHRRVEANAPHSGAVLVGDVGEGAWHG
jgi:hypothetical protein